MDGLFEVIILSLISAFEVIWVLSRFILPLEFVIIFLVAALVVVSVLNMQKARVFWRLMFLVFCISLLNLGFLFLRLGMGIVLYVCLMLSCVGMGIAIMNMYVSQRKRGNRKKVIHLRMKEEAPEPPSYIPDPPDYVAEGRDEKAETAVRKEFSPGKYVVSRSGKQYHVPKCVWAKKINDSNRMWFDTEKAAEKKGYTRHWCVKE